jgi:hypothetical protein
MDCASLTPEAEVLKPAVANSLVDSAAGAAKLAAEAAK